MRVLVTGGCGYVGSVLVPKLLEKGHHVTVRDLMWFGNNLSKHDQLDVQQGDFRTIGWLGAFDAVIHLAGIANDPTGDLDPKLTWEVNALGTMRLAALAKEHLIKQFIYASSGSVYGVSNAPQVNEGTALDPISEYNKTKMVAERCVLSYANPSMVVQIVRPATVCGVSPRQRLDVVVNLLTMLALRIGSLALKTPEAIRPNIHVEDMADLYVWLLERPQLGGIWNAGFENLSVSAIAQKVADRLPVSITTVPSNDPRSYRMNSDKLLEAGFKPKKTVDDAIDELIVAYAAGSIKDEDECYNIRTMKKLSLQSA